MGTEKRIDEKERMEKERMELYFRSEAEPRNAVKKMEDMEEKNGVFSCNRLLSAVRSSRSK